MKIFFIIISVVLFITCQQEKIVTDTSNFKSLKLELIQENDLALLRITSNESITDKKLKLPPPCYFLRENGEIQSFSYPEVEVDNVLIIIGDIATKEDKEMHGVAINKVCGKKIQGILIKNGKATPTEKTLSGALSCKDNGLDEKDFWDFAHRPSDISEQ